MCLVEHVNSSSKFTPRQCSNSLIYSPIADVYFLIQNFEYLAAGRRRSGEISYLHFVKTATIPMVPYVTTLNFHDISNVHVQVRNWRYEISPLRRRGTETINERRNEAMRSYTAINLQNLFTDILQNNLPSCLEKTSPRPSQSTVEKAVLFLPALLSIDYWKNFRGKNKLIFRNEA
ncbi:unnamed protein product [Nesidiocoris tenuis]|uniref:Uncharacterized protein n=1 Tax=Nesidiocoris tenuis TaxID=355587 RepID=A0A6H5G227_9HEMI|nr:unnamed protein product [Nesidiocoris tenuis]